MIGVGFVLGRIQFGSVEVGSTTGVLLAGLLFGHLGFPDRPGAAVFGFTLFIFSVGLQAGPRFFSAFLADGAKYVALSVVVAATAIALVVLLSRWIGLGTGSEAGLLAGALTSTPTLAGAQDAIASGLARLPPGTSPEQAIENLSTAYAITYLFGTVGLIAFVRVFPAALGVDLCAEAREVERSRTGEGLPAPPLASALPIVRAYRVPDGAPAVGATLAELAARLEGRSHFLRLRRAGELLEPDPTLALREGDVVSLIGPLADHVELQNRVGQEVLDAELLNYQIATWEIVVDRASVVGRTLRELDLVGRYASYANGLVRAGIELPVGGETLLHKGDRLRVTGEVSRLGGLAEEIGHVEERIEETDLLTFAFGVCGGVLLGLVFFKIGHVSIGLGSAGGLLLTGILIGFLSSLHPTFGRVPAAARYVLMELGLMLFMTSVGLKAGSGILTALGSLGPQLILCGVVVTLAPMLVGYAFGRRAFGMNPALLLGSLTGAMTSTPALKIVTSEARSSVPALGYAGTYTFANVLLTFAGALLAML